MVLPKDVRDKLGLEAGQRFEVQTMSDGAILVIPIPQDVVAAMELPEAGRLERALLKERKRDLRRERPGKHRRV